jgi:pseudaminic acid cytidylyltransferase
MKLAIIPARGGSQRIPRKNIKPFGGKPIIAWSIAAAQDSGIFDYIMVSTDDAEIANIAHDYGADVPFMRPSGLSDDHTGIMPVVRHAVKWCKTRGLDPAQVCCIYATAPFIRSSDIRKGFDLLAQTEASFVFSVTSYAFPIQRAFKLLEDGSIEMFDPTQFLTRSQDLPEAYHDAGQFYWGTQAAWLSGAPMFGSGSVPVILPRYRVQDIDTLEDWQQAEALMKIIEID